MINKLKTVVVFVGIFIIVLASSLALSGCKNNNDVKLYEVNDSDEISDVVTDNADVSHNTEPTEEYVYVQLCGAVLNPGVYKILSGARIYEAVEEAGGLLEEADTRAVNMAKPVEDGIQIYIPSKDETYNGTDTQFSENTQKELLDINKAAKEELMELPGIGEAKAESIIAYRKEHGAFKDITEIMNISGIKESAFSKIKDKIKV